MPSTLRKHIRRLAGASTVSTALAAALVAFALPASAAVTPAATPAPRAHVARQPHIMYIMLENTDYSQSAGASSMPYWNELAHEYAVFTQSFGWTYPSEPNYMEFLTGSTEGLSGDCDPGIPGESGCPADATASDIVANTLTDEMENAGISWHAYFQADPTGCYQGSGGGTNGNYDDEHNPFELMADFAKQCPHLSNFDSLIPNLNSPNAADFNWVIPDLDNDGGDNGTMYSGDTWMNAVVPQILNSTWYKQGGQVIISYDTGYQDTQGLITPENVTNPNGPGGLIPAIVISAHTKGMGVVSLPHNTAGLLRSVEEAYGLPLLGDSADPANGSLGNALVSGRPEGPPPSPAFNGAIFRAGSNKELQVTNLRGPSESFNGIYRFPDGQTIEAGENNLGQGIVATPTRGAFAVPGTTNLMSISCVSASTCYAVGLGILNNDDAAVVTVVNGIPATVTQVPDMYAFYGVSCPTTSTCYAVGYDTSDAADAVVTITNGVPGQPIEVPENGAPWLNAISCPTATQCYAAGINNYQAAIVPIVSGIPQNPIPDPDASSPDNNFANLWYLNGIDCPSVGNCVAVGETASTQQGAVVTLVNGQLTDVDPTNGPTAQVVPNTSYLYGVACTSMSSCILVGSSAIGTNNEPVGAVSMFTNGTAAPATVYPQADGFGPAVCGTTLSSCDFVGSSIS
jgi:phosphatidylinositol-3-phosphatase